MSRCLGSDAMAAAKLSAPSARRVYPRVSASERAKLRAGLAEDSDTGNVNTGALSRSLPIPSNYMNQISIPGAPKVPKKSVSYY